MVSFRDLIDAIEWEKLFGRRYDVRGREVEVVSTSEARCDETESRTWFGEGEDLTVDHLERRLGAKPGEVRKSPRARCDAALDAVS